MTNKNLIYENAKKATLEKVKIHEMINFREEQTIKVSIVIPVCNVEQYLRECLESAVNQTLKEIEIICVNDGSTDASLELLKEYAAKDSRVKVIDKENAGYGHAMNIGMDMAKGEYIGILESDDHIGLSMMEDLYIKAKSNQADIVKGDFYRFTTEKGYLRLFYCRLSEDDAIYHSVLNAKIEKKLYKFTNTWAGIYRKDFLQENLIRHQESPGASFQDNGFWYLSTVLASRIVYIDKPYYYNRRDNPNSSVYQFDKAYLINGEYQFIETSLKKHALEKYVDYAYLFQKKFDAYKFNYRRIDPSLKKEYIERIANEYREDLEEGFLSADTLSESDRQELEEILQDPKGYFERIKEETNYSYDKKESSGVVSIAFICDDGYVLPTVTAIRSLVRHVKTQSAYDITVIGTDLSDENIRKLTYVNKTNVAISVVVIEEDTKQFHTFGTTKYGVSNTALLKFILPGIFRDHDKLLYLDGDIAVMKDLTELFNTDIEGCYAGVVLDMPQVLYERQIFGKKFGRNYFNSGVLLLNLKQMREDAMQEKLIEEKQSSKSKLMDQDVFNELFKGKVKYLPISCNTLYVNLIRSKGKYRISDINETSNKNYNTLEDIRRDSQIIHYCSEDKPWKYYDTPMADYWLFIYFLTQYKKRLCRISVGDQCKEGIVNGKIIFAEPGEVTAIVFFYRAHNSSEISHNIRMLEETGEGKYHYYLFYDESILLDPSCFEVSAPIEFVSISRSIQRDREYSVDGRLDGNYYRMLVPEILSQYDKAVIIDGCRVSPKLSWKFIREMNEENLMYMLKTPSQVTFWESPLIVIDINRFITNKIKFKYWDHYRKSKRPGQSIALATSDQKIMQLNWGYILVEETMEIAEVLSINTKLQTQNDAQQKQIASQKVTGSELVRQNAQKEEKIAQLESELVATRTSFSCRLGLFLTALPRKLLKK